MNKMLILLFLYMTAVGYGQNENRVSNIDFVQIVDNNRKEAIFYYKNNWKVLRDMALEKNYIHSFELLETPFGKDEPFQLMLITTYLNQSEHEKSEERFDELIAERGPLRLLNGKKPGEFRKVLFSKTTRHLH